MEINPRKVFERMFGQGGTAAQRLARRKEDQSILDAIRGEAKSLQLNLPASDKTTLEDYMENIREIERRIERAAQNTSDPTLVLPEAPAGIPYSYEEHVDLMFDLLAIAYQANITRVATFMMAREVSYRTFPMLGISEGFHPASHHQNNAERLENLTKINTYHVSLIAHLLNRLKSTPDGDGTLLDHSLILFGSGMSNSNVHDHSPLPVLVAGGASSKVW